VVFFVLLAGCTPDPAELGVSLVEPATANAQYFHGNCFAGFSVGVGLRIRETRGIEVVISRLAYRVRDRGTGQVLADESLDGRSLEERYGGSARLVRAGETKTFPLAAISSERPEGPLAVQGEIEGMDENEQRVFAAFDLPAELTVNDPGPPAGGACSGPSGSPFGPH